MKSRKCFMGKLVCAACAASAVGAMLSVSALAGTWKPDAAGWQYQNDDGSYAANGWEWIDGNGDGISECYCFNDAGYLLTNTTTPDGYEVNADGAWMVDGQVQTRASSAASGQGGGSAASGDDQIENLYGFYLESTDKGVILKDGRTKVYGIGISHYSDRNTDEMGFLMIANENGDNHYGGGSMYKLTGQAGNIYTFQSNNESKSEMKAQIEKSGDTIRFLSSDDYPELVGASFVWKSKSYLGYRGGTSQFEW